MRLSRSFFIVSILIIYSCTSDDIQSPESTNQFIGQWRLTISPLNDVKSHEVDDFGEKETDFESESSDIKVSFFERNDFENLYANYDLGFSSGDLGGVSGHSHYYKLNEVGEHFSVSVFQHGDEDGIELTLVAEFGLAETSEKVFEGEGRMLYDLVNDTAETDETFTVKLVKINDVPDIDFSEANLSETSTTHVLCQVSSAAVSTIVSSLSGGIVHPMSGCHKRKDGGGYYMYDNVGPGSIFPIWTQTAYVPVEWSFCKARHYTFHIKKESDNIEIEDLLNYIEDHGHHLLKPFELEAISELNDEIQDLHDKVGHFAISVGYNTRSRNGEIYVNIKNYHHSHHDIVKGHKLIRNLYNKLSEHVDNDPIIKVGENLEDKYLLRRSPVPVAQPCNTPVVFIYVVGTIKVKYQ